ncbi:vesicle-trafficking protein SEC22b [Patella vulgata]|uniref:Vesicle-trafficking protein SEC22b n=1 Tax=Patella caerulea TaxID=87958 RepID=A0AAN8KEM2_PATCE|nr:vesicle-trafficking protein SEC22b [Patella vulgata]
MVLLTMIARVADGLALAASVQEDEQAGRNLMEYQTQAKQLFRKISQDPQPPTRCSLESGPYIFHYLIERGVCFLVLCDKSFSKRLAYTFLEDIQLEFMNQYSTRVETVSRPYSFIEFDTYIQKTRKSYMDSRARRNLTNINTELHDVQRIMVQNIDDVLQRGETLSVLDTKASNLSTLSQKYKKDAKYLNLRSTYAKIGAVVIVAVVFLLFIYYWVL